MKTNLTTAIFSACVLLVASSPCAVAHTDITAAQARDLIASTPELVVVDVREQYEYCGAKGHIQGARNYPWNSGVLKARYEELPTNRPLLVVCASGGRSNQAANFLDSKGFPTVYDMKAGMSAWQWETVPCKYSGGSGTPDDPYQIAGAADLIALGEDPNDYDKHFILTADIDLDPNLPGGKVFDRAIIAPDVNNVNWQFDGIPFTGAFDGKGHAVSGLIITGHNYVGLFGGLGEQKAPGEVRNLGVVDVNIAGEDYVGGLAGTTRYGSVVTQCYSSGSVSGKEYVGGLSGYNGGHMIGCYSTVSVLGDRTGYGAYGGIGGLVGENFASLTDCYSIGSVRCLGPDTTSRGALIVGGLAGWNGMYGYVSFIANCFWDVETSGRLTSNGGKGLTTAEMQDAGTFMAWGTCGNEGTWTIDDGRDYPRLWWQNVPGEPIALGATLSGLLAGEGTEDSPYLIYTADDLNLVGLFACEWDKHYMLMADLDMSGFDGKDGRPPFNIIASGRVGGFEEVLSFRGIPFTGLFDGNSHTISNLSVRASACGGLFGGLGPAGEVRNVGITDVNIAGSGHDVGGLVGWSEGTVTGCHSTGTVSGKTDIGGLVGINYHSNVTQCHSAAMVSGSDFVGGLVGWNVRGTVKQCSATGAVSSTRVGGGGLVGINRGTIAGSHSSGAIRGDRYVGGLTGSNQPGSSMTQCYSTGSVTGTDFVGGLTGYNGGDVTNCYSTAGVTSNGRYVGGLAGTIWLGNIVQCYSTGTVTGVSEVGGLVGYNRADEGIVSGFWDVETSGLSISAGGTGKTTAEMKMANTFIEASWDFVGETANGTHDIWWIDEGNDYPRLWWEMPPKN